MMSKYILLICSLTLMSCSIKNQLVAVNHPNLRKPIGPYSHSISFDKLIFVSGQIGIDPKTNKLKIGIEEQIVQIFKNLKIILNENHSDFNHITKTTIFLTDLNQYEIVNKIYARYFQNTFPARSTIEVKALPRNASIEIECIAFKKTH